MSRGTLPAGTPETASKKPYRRAPIRNRRSAPTLALAALAALGSLATAVRAEESALAATASCAAPIVIDAAALPYSATSVDTRSAVSGSTAPAFPCYGKLMLPAGGQVQPSKVVWFSFTPQTTATYRIDTLGSAPLDFDTILGVYTGSCGTLAPVSGVCGKNGFYPDDAPGSLQSSITLNLSAGTTYVIAVGAIGEPNSYTGQVEASPGGTREDAPVGLPLVQ